MYYLVIIKHHCCTSQQNLLTNVYNFDDENEIIKYLPYEVKNINSKMYILMYYVDTSVHFIEIKTLCKYLRNNQLMYANFNNCSTCLQFLYYSDIKTFIEEEYANLYDNVLKFYNTMMRIENVIESLHIYDQCKFCYELCFNKCSYCNNKICEKYIYNNICDNCNNHYVCDKCINIYSCKVRTFTICAMCEKVCNKCNICNKSRLFQDDMDIECTPND